MAREQDKAALDEHVRRLVDAAPPLTPEQRSRLAVLLHLPAVDEMRERVTASRRAQGLPPTVEDPAVIERVASLLRDDTGKQARKPSSISDVVDEL